LRYNLSGFILFIYLPTMMAHLDYNQFSMLR